MGALVASRRRSELGHEHALLGVSSHPGDQVLYTDNGALLGNGNDATEALPLTNAGVIQTPGMSNTVLDQQPEIWRRPNTFVVNPLLRVRRSQYVVKDFTEMRRTCQQASTRKLYQVGSQPGCHTWECQSARGAKGTLAHTAEAECSPY